MTKYDCALYKIKADELKSLADPNRLMIIAELRTGEKTSAELATELEMSPHVTLGHIGVLRHNGVVRVRAYRSKDGKLIYFLASPKIAEACDMVHKNTSYVVGFGYRRFARHHRPNVFP